MKSKEQQKQLITEIMDLDAKDGLYEDEVEKMAQLFHNVYEELAPSFGYETRQETKIFDKNSNNGKLMIATIKKIKETLYTKEDVLKAGQIGEINHFDYKHIVSLLDEAKAINKSLKQPKK